MDKIDKLIGLLERLNAGEDPVAVKKEAQAFLASISPAELSAAEQKLVEAGLAPEDLRHLCAAHMEMLGGELERTQTGLKPGHVIQTMILEHEVILGLLDELEKTNHTVQNMKTGEEIRQEGEKLREIAEQLVGAEPHHQREEQVLFLELEKRGVFGPPQVMRMEHKQLREGKHKLKELAEGIKEMEFSAFKRELDELAKFIVFTLRDHIFKENNILYPTSLQVIREEDVWDKMKSECDKIGYCSFTPKAAA